MGLRAPSQRKTSFFSLKNWIFMIERTKKFEIFYQNCDKIASNFQLINKTKENWLKNSLKWQKIQHFFACSICTQFPFKLWEMMLYEQKKSKICTSPRKNHTPPQKKELLKICFIHWFVFLLENPPSEISGYAPVLSHFFLLVQWEKLQITLFVENLFNCLLNNTHLIKNLIPSFYWPFPKQPFSSLQHRRN